MTGTRRRARSATATFFATPAAFCAWLEQHHAAATELLVGFHKKDSGTPSITWPEAVDQALCFGWVDGVRRRLDDARYAIRFTPRRPASLWSAVNIARIAALDEQGLLRPAGRRAFAERSAKKSRTYSYERSEPAALDPPLQKLLRASKAAWTFFEQQAPSYRRKVIHWIQAARQAEVRERRLRKLLAALAAGRRL